MASASADGSRRAVAVGRASESNQRRSMPIAFKEWAVTVRALAEGEQLLTLRKGGIREENQHFELEHDRFFLYPTFDHQRNNLVRQSHHPELRRALEEGVWARRRAAAQGADPGRRHPRSPTGFGSGPGPRSTSTTRSRTRGSSTASRPSTSGPPTTPSSACAGSRGIPLHVLVLRVYRIPAAGHGAGAPEYHGCASWVEIDRDLPFEGTPVIADRNSSAPPPGSRRSSARRARSPRALPPSPYLRSPPGTPRSGPQRRP